jgi:hypothetical protein
MGPKPDSRRFGTHWLFTYIRLYVYLTRSLDVVDRVVLRSLGWFLQPRPRSTSSRRHTGSHSGRRVRHPQHASCPFVLVLSAVDLAHSRTVHSRGVWCHACAARRSLRGPRTPLHGPGLDVTDRGNLSPICSYLSVMLRVCRKQTFTHIVLHMSC